MEFVCVRKKKYQPTERWDGTIEVMKVQENLIEAIVEGRGSSMNIVIGDYSNGHFICIPDLDVGCPLAAWNDLYWNYERLSALICPVDAITVVAGVASLMGGGDREHEHIFYY